MSTWVYNDGGRAAAGYKGATGDCVTRAIAIATGLSYVGVYKTLAILNAAQRRSKREIYKGLSRRLKSAANGISTKHKWFDDYMQSLGFRWIPTMQIGQGCKVHLRAEELPAGILIVSVSKHLVAVIDRVIQDTYDCSRNGTRCVYGYWIKETV